MTSTHCTPIHFMAIAALLLASSLSWAANPEGADPLSEAAGPSVHAQIVAARYRAEGGAPDGAGAQNDPLGLTQHYVADGGAQVEGAQILTIGGPAVGFESGIPGSFSVTDEAGTGLVWSVTGDCDGITDNWVNNSPTAACVNSDGNPNVNYDTSLVSNEVDMSTADSCTTVNLDFMTNFRNVEQGDDRLDVDVSDDGGATWTTELTLAEDIGGFEALPGVPFSVDLASYLNADSIRVRFRYHNPNAMSPWDWYAQVDDIAISCLQIPGIEVMPDAITQTQAIDSITTSTMTIENTGLGSLSYDLYESDIPAAAGARGNVVLWEQVENGTGGIVSDFYLDLGPDMGGFSADDFVLDDPTSIELVFAAGFLLGSGSLTNAESINWYIFADDNGVPAGNPVDGGALWSYTAAPTDPGVDITDNDIALDILIAQGSGVSLDPGTYWLSVVPSMDVAAFQRWNWHQGAPTAGTQPGHLIDFGVFGFPAGWQSIPGLGLPAYEGLAMRLEGEVNPVLETCDIPSDLTWLSVSPASGSVAAGEQAVVTVTTDTTGLIPGTTYTGTLCVDSDAPDNPLVRVPVSLDVHPEFTVGGMVFGLEGSGLVLQTNGIELTIDSGATEFTFPALDDGTDYEVSVLTDPTGPSQTCEVTNGIGTLAGANVTDVEVTCSTDQFTVGGMVFGLEGSGLVLQTNGIDLPIGSGATEFTFPALDDGTDYDVSVLTDPTVPSQTCEVTNGTGTLAGADVINIEVNCTTDQFTVGGTVSGLNGTGLVLQTNGIDLPIGSGATGFTFPALDDGTDYDVSVLTDPTVPSQTCEVTNGTGTLAGADVINIEVNCTTDQFTVGGTISGLNGTGLVLQTNDLELPIDSGATEFTFPAQDDGTAYDVSVLTDPTDLSQTCEVTNSIGTLAGANVTDVEVTCTTDQFTIGGTISGLNGTGLVLQTNGLELPIDSGATEFTFPAQDDGTAYDVSVLTDPTDLSQTCEVTNAIGMLAGANVTDVEVTCTTDQFTIGGTISGLNGTGLVLQTNGLELPIDSGATEFTFPSQDDGTDYEITVLTQPASQRDQQCEVSNAIGTLAGADVTDVVVSCQDITLGLSASDLDLGLVFLEASGSETVTVTNSGTVDLTLSAIASPAAPFGLNGGTCLAVPLTLEPGASCTIDVGFTPTEVGAVEDQIVITSNAISSPDTINLRGVGNIQAIPVPVLDRFGLLLLTMLMLLIAGVLGRQGGMHGRY